MKVLSRVWLFVTPWTVAHQAPLSMEFSRQEYWSGLPFPSPGDLPDPGIEPRSPTLQADTSSTEPPGNPKGTVNAQDWTTVCGVSLTSLHRELLGFGACLKTRVPETTLEETQMQNFNSMLNHTSNRGYASLIIQTDAFLFEMRLPYPICIKSEGGRIL